MSRLPDHPRVCGENIISCAPRIGSHGSPPRVRGKRDTGEQKACAMRITPAHAGKTKQNEAKASKSSDHPRACGENALCAASSLDSYGSPPRMRGKQGADGSGAGAGRITPAHAGKTGKYLSPVCSRADHPRACGENYFCAFKQSSVDGSPPRMRGKRKHRAIFRDAGRITPAHAGKTDTLLDIAGYAADHPRACGENDTLKDKNGRYRGSPPRVRGKPSVVEWVIHKLRITPACAGKTEYMRTRVRFLKDHPRVCGENFMLSKDSTPGPGSPPRVRGKHIVFNSANHLVGITPACAGKTSDFQQCIF